MILANKKGQVALLMLFLVAVVLVIVALFVFATFDKNLEGQKFSSFEISVELNYKSDLVIAYAKMIAGEAVASNAQDLIWKFRESAASKKSAATSEGRDIAYGNNFFDAVEKDFIFEKIKIGNSNDAYNLKIDGLSVKKDDKFNEHRYYFNLCMLFDANGVYLDEGANLDIYKVHCA